MHNTPKQKVRICSLNQAAGKRSERSTISHKSITTQHRGGARHCGHKSRHRGSTTLVVQKINNGNKKILKISLDLFASLRCAKIFRKLYGTLLIISVMPKWAHSKICICSNLNITTFNRKQKNIYLLISWKKTYS